MSTAKSSKISPRLAEALESMAPDTEFDVVVQLTSEEERRANGSNPLDDVLSKAARLIGAAVPDVVARYDTLGIAIIKAPKRYVSALSELHEIGNLTARKPGLTRSSR